MWTRSLLKQNAKLALSGRYWRCFLVCLVVGLLTGGLSGITNIADAVEQSQYLISGDYSGYLSATDQLANEIYNMPAALAGVFGVMMVLGWLVALLWNIFVANPLEAGKARYFMESRQAAAPYTTVTGIFRKPYGRVVEAQLLTNLKIFLGSLIIIPGIYWSFCYALVPYLLAENPYMTASRAMELSKEMMYGEKWNYFVLGLSFIGWELLCCLTMGIGFLFLNPYIAATYAEFYAAMRSKALAQGMSNPQELGGFVCHEQNA